MKKIISISVFFMLTFWAYTQGVSINENGIPPDPSAMLDISSYTKGILVPRLRTLEREAINGPAEGLLVYDIDTHSFWFANFGVWKEILNAGSPLLPTGPAGGDLTGDYPMPTVAKIQNLAVSPEVPGDKQVLKFDEINNIWIGQNDSLFLPYVASATAPNNLFSITNNFNGFAYTTAILGRRLGGSGIGQTYNSGVWGDADAAPGIAGTSNSLPGVLGRSISYHGIQGMSSGGDGYAGIYGTTDVEHGYGVMGSINQDGISVFGNVLGTKGTAGVFQSPVADHDDVTLVSTTTGLGMLSFFKVFNINNTNPAMDITHKGNGNGLKINLTKSTADANAVEILHEGTGKGIYSSSALGTAGKFENTNVQNTSAALVVGTNSLGTSLAVQSSHSGLAAPVVDVTYNGTGTGVNVYTLNGNPATLAIGTPESTKTNLIIQQPGSGKGIYVNQTNSGTNNAAIDIVSQGNKGVAAQVNANNAVAILGATGATASNPIGVKGLTAPNAMNGIGVLGQAGANDINGIGVKGIAGGGINGGIGVLGETFESNPQAIAVKGIGYTHNEDVGAITGINMTDGVGVFGESLGMGGIGIAATVGNTGNNSIAAKFRNNFVNSSSAVLELVSNGKGTSIFSDNTNLTSTATMLKIRNAGTGKFLTFETNLGEIKMSVAKSGDVVTDGTMTVKENMGIVRNSSGTQLRTEIILASIPAGGVNHYDEFNSWDEVDIDFGTAFSAPPAVHLGNLVSGGMAGLKVDIEEVTTTGFKIVIKNYTPHDFNYGASSFKVIAIGPE